VNRSVVHPGCFGLLALPVALSSAQRQRRVHKGRSGMRQHLRCSAAVFC